MITTTAKTEDLTLNITEEIHVRASLEVTFATLMEQLGPLNEKGDNQPMPMKIEPWPGGRWFRDLGEDNGHFWGNVQAIKRPTLLEICGPLFMSAPVASNLQYRLSEVEGGTLIKFRHTAFGLLPEDAKNVKSGWGHMHGRLKARAEEKRSGQSAGR